MKGHWLKLLALVAVVGAAVAVWRYTPLGEWVDAERIAALMDDLQASRWAAPILFVAFVVGGLVSFPVTVLIVASGLTLGMKIGAVVSAVGVLASAGVTFWVGSLVGRRTIENLGGGRVGQVSRWLGERGVISIMTIRIVPIAPFTLINVIAGATHISLRDYLLGTALGMFPGIVVLTVLGGQIQAVVRDPNVTNVALLVGAGLAWILIGLGLQRAIMAYRKRRRERREAGRASVDGGDAAES